MVLLEFWHWYVIALFLVVMEGMLVSGVFASMAVAAAIVGTLFFTNPELTWQVQLAIFAGVTFVLSFISIRLMKRFAQSDGDKTSPSDMVGKEFIINRALQNGFSETEIEGNFWSIKGPNAPAGTLVKVVDVDGDMLLVLPKKLPDNSNPQHSDMP